MAKYVDVIYPLMAKVLKLYIYQRSTKLENEGEVDIDQNLVAQQAEILRFLADFIDSFPMGMAANFADLFDVLGHYSPYTTRQMIGFLYCMGQMIHLATESIRTRWWCTRPSSRSCMDFKIPITMRTR